MGAKQSKRSVDISGKEAESAGEVAAAGAGGEGRMEPLADVDALKPQANGDAHIHDTPEKEKQIDSGTPEIEKDVTTEKEIKDQEETEKQKEKPVVSNGEGEPKVENGESTPSSEDGKKNKKEKVKKKWSLRSISFSRKDKPKQEKKQKEDEVKTNGEPEKVPEEAAEIPEVPEKESNEETMPDTDNKNEKTPETPVTEPLTNGSNTPESPKVDTPIVEEPKHENVSDIRLMSKAEIVAPEQLPINGLFLEEAKKDEPVVPAIDSNVTEEPPVETPESVPTSECPIIKEVCVDQKPLIEPTPPPLPANPPPSSVASFAATTMAPELTDASVANADNTESAHADVSTVANDNTNTIPAQIPVETVNVSDESETVELPAPFTEATPAEEINTSEQCSTTEVTLDSLPSRDDHDDSTKTVEENVRDVPADAEPLQSSNETAIEPEPEMIQLAQAVNLETIEEIANDTTVATPEDMSKETSNSELSKTEQDSGICDLKETEVDVSVVSQNGLNHSSDEAIATEGVQEEVPVLNGERYPVERQPEIEESFPLPPADLCCTDSEISPEQESLPIADKLAELMPEIPSVPEINTDMETTTDVAVAN